MPSECAFPQQSARSQACYLYLQSGSSLPPYLVSSPRSGHNGPSAQGLGSRFRRKATDMLALDEAGPANEGAAKSWGGSPSDTQALGTGI